MVPAALGGTEAVLGSFAGDLEPLPLPLPLPEPVFVPPPEVFPAGLEAVLLPPALLAPVLATVGMASSEYRRLLCEAMSGTRDTCGVSIPSTKPVRESDCDEGQGGELLY